MAAGAAIWGVERSRGPTAGAFSLSATGMSAVAVRVASDSDIVAIPHFLLCQHWLNSRAAGVLSLRTEFDESSLGVGRDRHSHDSSALRTTRPAAAQAGP